MLHNIRNHIWVSICGLFLLANTAVKAEDYKQSIIPSPPSINAKAYYLVDHNSLKVIAEKNATERFEPASLTKMMTVYVIDQEILGGKLRLDEEVKIGKKAWKTPGSRMFVDLDSKVSVQDLLKGIIIQSGNDASVALAEHIAGTEHAFADIMNFYAEKLGMHDTHFVNATGLPHPEHYSSAKDLAILARHVIEDFPETYKLYSEKWLTYNNIKQPNRNRLLWRDDNVDGIKTGHTDSAGFCFVASSNDGKMRLNAVVLGADNDDARMDYAQSLLNYGFRFYETHKVYAANEVLNKSRVWMGKDKFIRLGLNNDLYLTVPTGVYKDLKAEISVDQVIKAPVKRGQVFGSLKISIGESPVLEKPLVVIDDVNKGSIFQRFFDYIKLLFHKLFN